MLPNTHEPYTLVFENSITQLWAVAPSKSDDALSQNKKLPTIIAGLVMIRASISIFKHDPPHLRHLFAVLDLVRCAGGTSSLSSLRACGSWRPLWLVSDLFSSETGSGREEPPSGTGGDSCSTPSCGSWPPLWLVSERVNSPVQYSPSQMKGDLVRRLLVAASRHFGWFQRRSCLRNDLALVQPREDPSLVLVRSLLVPVGRHFDRLQRGLCLRRYLAGVQLSSGPTLPWITPGHYT